MRHSLAEAHREIRTLAYLLYPPNLSSQGLVATLRGFIDGFRRRTGLAATTHHRRTAGRPLVRHPADRVPDRAGGAGQRASPRRRTAGEHHDHAQDPGLRVIVTDDGQGGRVARTPGRRRHRGMQARLASSAAS
jgi:signal transduction histidine kinase